MTSTQPLPSSPVSTGRRGPCRPRRRRAWSRRRTGRPTRSGRRSPAASRLDQDRRLGEPAGAEQAAVVGDDGLDLEGPARGVDRRVDPRDLARRTAVPGYDATATRTGWPSLTSALNRSGTFAQSRSGFSMTRSTTASPSLSICPSETDRFGDRVGDRRRSTPVGRRATGSGRGSPCRSRPARRRPAPPWPTMRVGQGRPGRQDRRWPARPRRRARRSRRSGSPACVPALALVERPLAGEVLLWPSPARRRAWTTDGHARLTSNSPVGQLREPELGRARPGACCSACATARSASLGLQLDERLARLDPVAHVVEDLERPAPSCFDADGHLLPPLERADDLDGPLDLPGARPGRRSPAPAFGAALGFAGGSAACFAPQPGQRPSRRDQAPRPSRSPCHRPRHGVVIVERPEPRRIRSPTIARSRSPDQATRQGRVQVAALEEEIHRTDHPIRPRQAGANRSTRVGVDDPRLDEPARPPRASRSSIAAPNRTSSSARLRAERAEEQGVEEPGPVGVLAAEGEVRLERPFEHARPGRPPRRAIARSVADQPRHRHASGAPAPAPPCCRSGSRASAWSPPPPRRSSGPTSRRTPAPRTAAPPPARCAAPPRSPRPSRSTPSSSRRVRPGSSSPPYTER